MRRTGFLLALGASLALCGCPLVLGLDGFERGADVCQEEALPSPPGKADLLLVIDNSRSMSDKQELLAGALPAFIEQLVNPPCLTPEGDLVNVGGPDDACPGLAKRQFSPLRDLHIGIVTSSLGGIGSDACDPGMNATNNDQGHLVARKDSIALEPVGTYQDLGFLAWDPDQALTPAGTKDVADLVMPLGQMVTGVGALGCGYGSLLEAPYRFLVDPDPYESIQVDSFGAPAQLVGTDSVVLAQRKAFLRPDSVLVIVMLSDANDCSIKAGDTSYMAIRQRTEDGQLPFHMPRPRAACAANPDDPCCFSCAQTGPLDEMGNPICGPDSSCTDMNGQLAYLTDLEDSVQLRCFDQKRRFGIDSLYPIDRYVTGFSQPEVTDRSGQVVPNPIFSGQPGTGNGAFAGASGRVVVAGIVGVPWQDIARRNSAGKPDIVAGNDAQGHPVGGFSSWSELATPDGMGRTAWDIVLGDPAGGALPVDPFMHESIDQRSGENPITGDAIVKSPGGPGLDNAINGHEQALPQRDDIQFACIFDLATPRHCSQVDPQLPCVCNQPMSDNPLCAPDPDDNGQQTLQVKGGAWPSLRPLSLLKALGPQGIVASICPPGQSDVSTAYRSAVATIGDRVTGKLDVHCLGEQLQPDPETGEVPCTLLEGRHVDDPAACDCPSPGRQQVTEEEAPIVQRAGAALDASINCYCVVPQASGEALTVCKNDITAVPRLNGEPVNGFCYLDAVAKIGAPELAGECDSQLQLRLLGAAKAAEGSALYLSCTSKSGCGAD